MILLCTNAMYPLVSVLHHSHLPLVKHFPPAICSSQHLAAILWTRATTVIQVIIIVLRWLMSHKLSPFTDQDIIYYNLPEEFVHEFSLREFRSSKIGVGYQLWKLISIKVTTAAKLSVSLSVCNCCCSSSNITQSDYHVTMSTCGP